MKIIGWGVAPAPATSSAVGARATAAATPYWLVVNSRGSDWGESGLFRIRRGVNELGIEDQPTAGMPRARTV